MLWMRASFRSRILVAAFIVFLPLTLTAFTTQARFEHINTADGLPNDAVSAIVQDSRGFLWLGTQGGLVRWDGYRFELFENEPFNDNTLIHNQIQTLFLDGDTLWIGTYGGLDRFDLTTHKFSHFHNEIDNQQSLGQDLVIAIGKDRNGKIWVGTQNGLYRMDDPSGIFTAYLPDPDRVATPNEPGPLPGATVRAIHLDRKGRLWIGTGTGGLALYDEKTDLFRVWTHDEKNQRSLPSNIVMDIDEDQNGRFWFALWNGGLVSSLDPETGVFQTHRTSDQRIYAVYAQEPFHVYVASWGGGLFEWNRDGESFVNYRTGSSPGTISHDVVYSFLLDRSGDLWIGTNGGGLNRVSRNEGYYEALDHDPSDAKSISAGKVTSIIRDHNDRLWAGVYNGGLNLYDDEAGAFTHFRHDPKRADSLPNDIINALYEDSRGRLWIATNGGLARYDEARNVFVTWPRDTLPDTIFYAILEHPDGRLWLGTYQQGLVLLDTDSGQVTHYPPDPKGLSGPRSGLVFCMEYDNSGRLWIGTNQGLSIFDGSGFRTWTYSIDDRTGISSDTIRCMYKDSTGVFWLGTTGGGLLRAEAADGVFTLFSRANGLPSLNIRHIIEDRKGNLWVGTSSGLTVKNKGDDVFRGLSVFTNLKNRDFHTGTCRDVEGNIYFGGTNVMYRINPNNLPDERPIPRVEIADFRLGEGRTQTETDAAFLSALHLGYRENTFSVEFAVIDFSQPDQNMYTYFLEGFDKAWKNPTRERRAEYTNLPGGMYTLRVRGSNADGIWTDVERTLDIKVDSPPYLQPWAWLIYLAFLVGIGYLIAKLRNKQQLAQKVAELTKLKIELENLNARLVEQNRIDGLTGISNRRHFDEYSGKTFFFAKRDNLPISALMIDLDFFKLFNDLEGHQRGDDVLKLVAGTLRLCVDRTTDLVARYGGEEFSMILYDTDAEGAMLMGERMRKAIWDLGVEHPAKVNTGRLTISVGVSTVMPGEAATIDELIGLADKALYRAKANGRNRVELAKYSE